MPLTVIGAITVLVWLTQTGCARPGVSGGTVAGRAGEPSAPTTELLARRVMSRMPTESLRAIR